MIYYWLTTHVPYACRRAGACCTARWPIPIERNRLAAVERVIAAGSVTAPGHWYCPAPDAPPDVAGVLALQPSGACVFYRRFSPSDGSRVTGGCAIHAMRPSSCAHFPYVCVTDARGVHVTLSHFCPTAANLLFDVDAPLRVVAGPPVFSDGQLPEGLDAREALPPLGGTDEEPSETVPLAGGAGRAPRLLSWEAVTAWEQARVARLGADDRVPEPPRLDAFDQVRAAVPTGWEWPEAPPGLADDWARLVAPAWRRWWQPIGRYLAAKAHASWAMYLGDGFRDVDCMVDLARTVLQVEAVRQCCARRRDLDRVCLTVAIRQSDLLLMHYADPVRLAPSAR